VDESAGNHEGHHIFRLHHNFVDLILNLDILVLQLQLPFDLVLPVNFNEFVFIKFLSQLLFMFWILALALELVETVHNHVLRMNIFRPHHI